MTETGNARPAMEYQALVTVDVMSDLPKRDVLIAFRGDPSAEEYDLAVRLPVGAVGALATLLHKACAEADQFTADRAAVMQPLMRGRRPLIPRWAIVFFCLE